MREFDRKNRRFFDELTDEERRKFSPFLMIRWGSSVEGSRELQEFYVIATNERLNKHFFAINATRHKKLQWLMATAVSPDLGTHRHTWIAPKKKSSDDSKTKKILMSMYPGAKSSDIDLLSKLLSSDEIKQMLKDHGE